MLCVLYIYISYKKGAGEKLFESFCKDLCRVSVRIKMMDSGLSDPSMHLRDILQSTAKENDSRTCGR